MPPNTRAGTETNLLLQECHDIMCFQGEMQEEHNIFEKPSNIASDTSTVTVRGGWIIHEHPDETSEGFGSHARGVLFPLIHIATVAGLEPVFRSKSVFENNTARDYSRLDVHDFLDLRRELPFECSDEEECGETKCEVLTFNSWADRTIGSACGDGKILASYLKDHLQQWRQKQDARADRVSPRGHRPFVIRLVGALRYMDPTPEVYQFLQNRSLRWKLGDEDCHGRSLRVAVHVRVPEDFCPQSWKDDNHVSKLFPTLKKLEHFLYEGARTHKTNRFEKEESSSWDLSVYTEERFSQEDEGLLKQHYPDAKVHRGTCDTLLSDIKGMSTADIFVPSSSHLSALAGYLTHGLIVLSDPSRWDYFQPHKQLGCQILDIHDMDSYAEGLFNRIAAATHQEGYNDSNEKEDTDHKHSLQESHNNEMSNLARSDTAV